MGKFQDLTGQTRNRLTVISRAESSKRVKWLCQCECGNTTIVAANHFLNDEIQSCGCLDDEKRIARNTTHGMSKTPEWFAYWAAKRRCSPTNEEKRADYYDRGIRFLFTSFEQFFAEVGLRPTPKHSIDRMDNDGNYEPGNIRWATATEQIRNQRCNVCIRLKARIQELESQLAAHAAEGI